ncbi:hypothetical protein LTR56_023759 [Elasticomyces elasticus]|nr:hypothetical protein LTR56_023759 [Elasticomyces elasticus]KAK3662371.1 hypothetical protein LTR22_006904 [Elasticomyces elasticus]KAK4924691.1 hypothetical protein LTR49_008140 [Elasticomyces elasticus]KAK5766904.1 hypothetical protein LTS12_002980 [Elasticomyces elasticus]
MAAMSDAPDRSLAQEHDTVKSEFPDDQVIVNNPGEVINLDSDDEGNLMPAPPARRPQQQSVAPSDDGLFVPETAAPLSVERTREVQARFAQQMRSRLAVKANAAGTTESDAVASQDDAVSEMAPPTSRKRDEESKAFSRIKAAYTRKKNAGTLSIEYEVEYMKAEAAEQARLHKAQMDEEWAREDTADDDLSIPETGNDGFVVPSLFAEASDDDEVPETPVRSKKRTSDGAMPAPKKARKTTAAKATAKDTATKKKAPVAKGKASKGKAGQNMTNLKGLMGTDVFGDAAATANLRSQPTSFGANVPARRDKALAQLIASVPTEDKRAAGSDKRLLDAAIKKFTGQGSVKASSEGDGNWMVTGMRSTLKHYQILGAGFMREREGASTEPKGGILADQMGLGKTVMMLANIVNGKPKKNAKRRATLIVASPALIAQWAHEIEKHTMSPREDVNHGVGWIRNHAGHRLSTSNNIETMEKADIVLTSYHEICRSYPSAVIPPQYVTAKQKNAWWEEHFHQEKGDFHRVEWLRVVLDEAQAIKNHRSVTSNACRALDGRHYWAITGTPVQNSVAEFYPYMKFIREPAAGSYRLFKENCAVPGDPDSQARLAVFLRKVMIRRTHLDTLFNARLLDLPAPKEHTFWVEFNDVERQIYEIIKKRYIEHINTIAKQGGLEYQKKHIWTMILRLRQICSHLLLVQGPMCDLLEREDYEKLNSITQAEHDGNDEGANLLIHLRRVLKSNMSVKSIHGGMQGAVISEGESVPMDLVDAEGAETETGGKHGLDFHFKKYLNVLAKSNQWEAIKQRSICSGCKQPPNDPVVTSCFHIYCSTCLTDLQHYSARRGHDGARCAECGDVYTSVKPCEGLEAFDRDASSAETTDTALPTKAKKKSKDSDMDDWIGLKGEILPSAKTQATKAQVMNWLEEDPDAKIIIFTQFLPTIRILAKVCKTEGWSFSKYSGEMSHEAREKAIQEFANKTQILICSLRSGGLGLNLTMASRVICLDPWWNSSVEQQAFCRVFRIGQTRETTFVRMVVKNTVDAAMMDMKERKQIEIDGAMDDSKGRDLPVSELLRLFGDVGEDADGKPFIWAQDDGAGNQEYLRVPNHDKEDEAQMMGDEE